MVRLLLCHKYLLVFIPLLAFVGCGERFHPVSGTVTVDGKPFDNGSITIVPSKGGSPAYGGTNEQGEFTLETNNKAGVRPGTYKVTLQKFASPKKNSKLQDDEGRKGNFDSMPKSAVPEKYTSLENTPISITVPSSDGKYLIDVKSK